MTREEFHTWLQSQKKASSRPKDIALVNCSDRVSSERQPGDETEFAPVSGLADRLQAALNSGLRKTR